MNQNISKSQILNELKQLKKFNSNVDFARYLGISPQNLSQWFARETFDINIVANKFPEVNTEWLLTGEGKMLKPVAQNRNDISELYANQAKETESTYELVKRQGELILEYGKEVHLANKQIGTMLLMIGALTNELKRVDPQNNLAEKASDFLNAQLNFLNALNHNNSPKTNSDSE